MSENDITTIVIEAEASKLAAVLDISVEHAEGIIRRAIARVELSAELVRVDADRVRELAAEIVDSVGCKQEDPIEPHVDRSDRLVAFRRRSRRVALPAPRRMSRAHLARGPPAVLFCLRRQSSKRQRGIMKNLFGETERGAVLSRCGRYRYQLFRVWDPDLPCCGWIGLNPSTADAMLDDHTIRRMVGFAKAWGYGSIMVLNLFAYRATDPDKMKRAIDPVGPDNDRFLSRYAPAVWVACWGVHGSHNGRADQVAKSFAARGVQLRCLGTTLDGAPRHPARLAADTPLEPWPATRVLT